MFAGPGGRSCLFADLSRCWSTQIDRWVLMCSSSLPYQGTPVHIMRPEVLRDIHEIDIRIGVYFA
jgi:ABC-type enterochelin transport system ATPase subunit